MYPEAEYLEGSDGKGQADRRASHWVGLRTREGPAIAGLSTSLGDKGAVPKLLALPARAVLAAYRTVARVLGLEIVVEQDE